MHANGFRQIAIAVFVAGDLATQPRQHIERIPVVSRLERFSHLREFKHQKFATGLEHATHFGQGLVFVGHVAQSESYADTIKVGRRERQFFSVAYGSGHHQAVVEQAVTPHPKHGFVDIGQPDFACRTGLARKRPGKIAGAAGDIKHFHAGPDIGARHREGFPDTVQTRRHKVVHDIVAISHRMENLGHLGRLFAFCNGFEAEVGGGRLWLPGFRELF